MSVSGFEELCTRASCGREPALLAFSTDAHPRKMRLCCLVFDPVETNLGNRSYKVEKKAPKLILPISIHNLGPASTNRKRRRKAAQGEKKMNLSDA